MHIQPFGKNTTGHLEFLESQADESLEMIKRSSIDPFSSKQRRTWGISEISSWVGKTTTAIRQVEDKIPELRDALERDENHNRRYSLAEVEMLRKHWNLMPPKTATGDAALVAVANMKGGVSKSITSVHLACALSRIGLRVLVVDMDGQASSTGFFFHLPNEAFEPEETVFALFDSPDADIKDIIRKTHWHGLDIVPSNLSLGLVDTGMIEDARPGLYPPTSPLVPHKRIARAVAGIRSEYDVIIIDTPPQLSMSVLAGLFAVEGIIVNLRPNSVDFSSTREFFSTLADLSRKQGKEFSFVRMMFAQVKHSESHKEIMHFLRGRYGEYIFETDLFESEALASAANKLQTIYDLERPLGSRDAHKRALKNMNEVCLGLIEQINPDWVDYARFMEIE